MEHETQHSSFLMRAVRPAIPLALTATMVLFPAAAFAIDPTDMLKLQERIDSTQQEVERTSTEYNDATAKAKEARDNAKVARDQVAKLEVQIEESQATIDQVSEQLLDQKDRSAEAMRMQYKMDADGLNITDVLLSSTTVAEFFTTLDYMDHLQDWNSSEIKKYTDMQAEYEQALETLETAKREADMQKSIAEEAEKIAVSEEERATQAMEEAKEARVKAQEEAEAEIERRAKELEAVGAIEDNIDWRVSRDEFVEEWSNRIDAYLAGSPMDGCGKAFAEAAWDYGVDPRWSPAIATIESSKGAAVPYYTSNNAWGWFANATNYRTFSSFEEGARLHVEYLGSFYGYTVTLDHAKVYCPPNAEKWYKAVVEQMRTI